MGFTTLSESRDAEDVRELLSEYFAQCRVIVGRYGGVIEKFIGDAVMAVWGVPVAHEDDAERSVRAGLELVEMVAVLGERLGLPGLSMRVGVVTGDEHTLAQQTAREFDRRHDAWASRDQRPVTDLDADHLHHVVSTTGTAAETYEPRRYHQVEPIALEHEAPSA